MHGPTSVPAYGIIPDDLLGIASRAVALSRFFHTHRFCGIWVERRRTGKRTRFCHCLPGLRLYRLPGDQPRGHRLHPPGRPILLASISLLASRQSMGSLPGLWKQGRPLNGGGLRGRRRGRNRDRSTKYRCSRPGQFPHSPMVGFTALYAGRSGSIRVRPRKLAGYSHASLPTLPAAGSITRILIDQVVEEISRDTKSSRP